MVASMNFPKLPEVRPATKCIASPIRSPSTMILMLVEVLLPVTPVAHHSVVPTITMSTVLDASKVF